MLASQLIHVCIVLRCDCLIVLVAQLINFTPLISLFANCVPAPPAGHEVIICTQVIVYLAYRRNWQRVYLNKVHYLLF